MLIGLFVTLQVAAKVCCIVSSPEVKSKYCGGDNTIQWNNITNNQIISCTQLQFFPKNYTLNENLKIADVSSFLINGSGATLFCNSSSLIINN